jgi:hypothetical protein
LGKPPNIECSISIDELPFRVREFLPWRAILGQGIDIQAPGVASTRALGVVCISVRAVERIPDLVGVFTRVLGAACILALTADFIPVRAAVYI